MNTYTMQIGDKVADTIETITPALATKLVSLGYAGVVRYVTSLTAQEVKDILASGLKLGLVTYADRFDPNETLTALAKLGAPKGIHVFLDVEAYTGDAPSLIARINAWAVAISKAGFIPAMYVGAGEPLDKDQLYYLAVHLYWHSCSRVLEPLCGYAMIQLHPGNEAIAPGLLVDKNVVQQDYAGRLPVFIGA